MGYAGDTHWRKDVRALTVQRKFTKMHARCTQEDPLAIVRRALYKFEVHSNAKIYA